MKEKKDKILKQFDLILEEIQGLVYSNDVWKELVQIQNNSKHFKRYGGHLQHWLSQNYTYRMILQLCKITEPNANKEDDVSFIKLLKQINEKKYISFKRFLQTYNPPPEEERKFWDVETYGNITISTTNTTINDVIKKFEDITKYPHQQQDFSEMIEAHIKQLKDIYDNLKKLRRKKLAHLTSTNVDQIPTYQELDEYVNIIKDIAQHYLLILYNTSSDFHFIDLNVKTVFEKAWIDKD